MMMTTIMICVACGRTEEFESQRCCKPGLQRLSNSASTPQLETYGEGAVPFLRGSPRRRDELTLTPFLEVRRLWHRYASSDWTLQDIDFSLEAGQLLGLLGPRGAAKPRCCA